MYRYTQYYIRVSIIVLCKKLFKNSSAFETTAEDSLEFIEAMREAVEFHRKNSKIYDGICSKNDFSFERDIKGEGDLCKIPHIMVNVFKEMKLLSVPESQITLSFTSSGAL